MEFLYNIIWIISWILQQLLIQKQDGVVRSKITPAELFIALFQRFLASGRKYEDLKFIPGISAWIGCSHWEMQSNI